VLRKRRLSAATICVKARKSGEFHGTIDTTTPYGRLSTKVCPFAAAYLRSASKCDA
jgi:hypothetical protein